MRALALSGSKAFSAVVLVLSLGPLAANVVCRLLFIYSDQPILGICNAHQQTQLGLGFNGFADPIFGCLVYEAATEQDDIT